MLGFFATLLELPHPQESPIHQGPIKHGRFQRCRPSPDADVITLNRRSSDRRQKKNPNATADGGTNPPRRKKQRRRHIDPTTCERDYNIDEIEFMRAMDDYKRDSGRMFPTCSEVLEVIRALGYVKLSTSKPRSFASNCRIAIRNWVTTRTSASQSTAKCDRSAAVDLFD